MKRRKKVFNWAFYENLRQIERDMAFRLLKWAVDALPPPWDSGWKGIGRKPCDSRALTVVTVWQEIEGKCERAYTADLERDKERLRILGLKHAPHRTALYRTRKRLSEEYMRRLNRKILEKLKPAEKVGDGRVLKPLVTKAQKHGEVKRALADGGYDSKENFNFLAEEGIDPAIKVRKNSSKKARGCWARKIVVTRYLRNPEGWKKKVGYGLRWMAETAFSTIKRLFGEHVTSRKFPNMVKEMLLKAALYNLFTNLNP